MNLYKRISGKVRRVLKGPKRYRQLFREIKRVGPKKIMEIGTWTGTRAVQMINEAKNFNSTRDIYYYGFDLFEGLEEEKFQEEISKRPPKKAEVLEKLEMTQANIHLFQGDTTDVLPRVVGDLPKMDFVFIDGGHSIATIKSDWENVQKLMHQETVVIFDDYWRNRADTGAKPVVDAINREKYNVEVLPVVDTFSTEWGRLEIQFARVTKK